LPEGGGGNFKASAIEKKRTKIPSERRDGGEVLHLEAKTAGVKGKGGGGGTWIRFRGHFCGKRGLGNKVSRLPAKTRPNPKRKQGWGVLGTTEKT